MKNQSEKFLMAKNLKLLSLFRIIVRGEIFIIKKKVLLLFHKPLERIDGQTKYVSALVEALSQIYEVVIPSETFFESNRFKEKKWLSRTLLVNFYIIKWILKSSHSLKLDYSFCVMEDRYVMLPTYIVSKISDIKIISRVSDWGKSYLVSLGFTGIFTYNSMYLLNLYYERFVLKLSFCVIVPSVNMYNEFKNFFTKSIYYFPQPFSVSKTIDLKSKNSSIFRDINHDVYCLLVGNYYYPPNQDSANFIVKDLAPAVKKIDPKIKFILIGDGSLEKYSFYNSDNLLSLGMIQNLNEIYGNFQIGINPSTAKGGTSIKIIEYLCNGLYVLATPESSIGVLKSSNLIIRNRDDFSQALYELANKIRRGEIEGRDREVERVRDHYSKSVIMDSFLQFIRSIE